MNVAYKMEVMLLSWVEKFGVFLFLAVTELVALGAGGIGGARCTGAGRGERPARAIIPRQCVTVRMRSQRARGRSGAGRGVSE
jgi:hypothetical protein